MLRNILIISSGRITYYSIFCFSASTSSVAICEVGGLGMLRARQFLDEKWKGQSEVFLLACNTTSSMYSQHYLVLFWRNKLMSYDRVSWTCQLHFNLCTFQSAKDDAEKGLLQHLFVQYPSGTHDLVRRYNTYFLTLIPALQWYVCYISKVIGILILPMNLANVAKLISLWVQQSVRIEREVSCKPLYTLLEFVSWVVFGVVTVQIPDASIWKPNTSPLTTRAYDSLLVNCNSVNTQPVQSHGVFLCWDQGESSLRDPSS